MSHHNQRQFFRPRPHVIPRVGDVLMWWNEDLQKNKFYLCVSTDFTFLYLNSPKDRQYPSDFHIPEKALKNLFPTGYGHSVLCCSTFVRKNQVAINSLSAVRKANLSANWMQDIFRHMLIASAVRPKDLILLKPVMKRYGVI